MDENRTSPSRQSSNAPRILLAATNRWSLPARVASGFLDLGCTVAAVCPIEGHPIRKVRGLDCLFGYAARSPLDSLRKAILGFAPDVIVPLCDRSVKHLHELYATCVGAGERGQHLCELIERSLGPASSFSATCSRYDLMVLAREAGIRIPETIRISSPDDLRQWQDRLPWLLKADGSSCGLGVKRADDISSATKAVRQLTKRLTAVGLISRLLLYRDRARTIATWTDDSPGVIAQAIVAGRPANCSVVCWKGKLLAGIAVEVVQTDGPCEPAIVVEVVEGREMLDAARRIASKLQLSGFFGVDFMIEESTNAAYLIEMNPRCAPPCSLNLGEGRDLLATFVSELTHERVPRRPAVTDKRWIAYFPTAVLRGINETLQPESFYLDMPVGQPELVEDLLHPWSELSIGGALFYGMRRNFPFKKQIRHWLRKDREQSEPMPKQRRAGQAAICASEISPQNDWR